MKAVATGRGKAWLVDLPVPRPEGNQVIVKLHSSPICGSNMGSFHGEGEWVNTGHEGAGEVVAVAHSSLLEPGERVALAPLGRGGRCEHCRSGDTIHCSSRPQVHGYFAQFTKVADIACTPLPEDIDFDRGSLLGCCLGPAYAALKGLGPSALDTVVVTGLGPVGLGAVALASFFAARVIAMDPVPYRRELAARLGAREVLDPSDGAPEKLLRAVGAEGVRKAVECSGRAEAQRLLIDCAAVHGRIAFVGENQLTIPVSPSKDLIRKGLTVFGCWHMNVLWAPELFGFLRDHRATMLISHRFGFTGVQKAFETFASRESAKVILKPWE
jgi:threonine dehydrogenase-like Zn-dependent dehydrogenase